MPSFYDDNHRQLQDRFDSQRSRTRSSSPPSPCRSWT